MNKQPPFVGEHVILAHREDNLHDHWFYPPVGTPGIVVSLVTADPSPFAVCILWAVAPRAASRLHADASPEHKRTWLADYRDLTYGKAEC